MALVSGRPISFQMDLYNPLYVARPTVEPELFASLRPPTYGGPVRGPAPDDFATSKMRLEERQDALKQAEKPGQSVTAGLGGRPAAGRDQSRRGLERASQVAQELKKELDLGRSVQTMAAASALGDYY